HNEPAMNAHFEMPAARLLGLGTAVPPNQLPQDLAESSARRILGEKFPEFERLAKSFRQSGIRNRYSVVPLDWFEDPKDWPARNSAYLDGATELFVAAAEQALHRSRLTAAEIDTVVTVSSTGIAT